MSCVVFDWPGMKMRPIALLACVCLLLTLLSTEGSAADRRVALVIGNSAYTNAPPLANTIADAVGLAQLFRTVGFETVISRTDLGVVDFKRAVREFLRTAEGADIAVVYYAGHGIEIDGTNYLVPIDAKLSRDYDVEDEAVALDRIIGALQSVKRLRLIILDACRDNPFPARMRSVEVRAGAGGGLGRPIDVGADTLVAYAAKAGSKSFDGDGPNSPFATALLRHLGEPGVDIRIALGRVRDDVLAMTGGHQEPFIYGSLGGATIALVLPPAKKIEAPPVTVGVAPKAAPTTAPSALAPQPVATSPTPPPQVPAPEPCSRDEQRLAQLRAEPARDQIVKFEKELGCARLRSQVQRLLESVGPTDPAGATSPRAPPRQQQAEARSAPDLCASDAQRLQRLRAEPNLDEIRNLERELACEQLRPQLRRLLESIGP
jgi:Caspase domain